MVELVEGLRLVTKFSAPSFVTRFSGLIFVNRFSASSIVGVPPFKPVCRVLFLALRLGELNNLEMH